MEVNPFKIGPFLLCYNEEAPFEKSTYWKLHKELKEKYNFFITNTSAGINSDLFLQKKLKGFVSDYENHCYVLSSKTKMIASLDIDAIATEFKNQNKELSHLAVIKIDETKIDLSAFCNEIKIFDFTENYQSIFDEMAKYFISLIEDPIIRFDLQDYFGIRSIIKVCSFVDEYILKRFLNNPIDLLNIDRRVFEELIAELFDGFGYEVELTKKTRDGGRDIIAIKNKEVQVKYLIECKKPDIGNKVGIRPIRELYGVKSDEGATKAILATTATFTKEAQFFLERNIWEMEGKDYYGLMEWINEYKRIKGWQ